MPYIYWRYKIKKLFDDSVDFDFEINSFEKINIKKNNLPDFKIIKEGFTEMNKRLVDVFRQTPIMIYDVPNWSKYKDMLKKIDNNDELRKIVVKNMQTFLKIRKEGVIDFENDDNVITAIRLLSKQNYFGIFFDSHNYLLFDVSFLLKNATIYQLRSNQKGNGQKLMKFFIEFCLYLKTTKINEAKFFEKIDLLNRAKVQLISAETYYFRYGFQKEYFEDCESESLLLNDIKSIEYKGKIYLLDEYFREHFSFKKKELFENLYSLLKEWKSR